MDGALFPARPVDAATARAPPSPPASSSTSQGLKQLNVSVFKVQDAAAALVHQHTISFAVFQGTTNGVTRLEFETLSK